jgi:Fanconi anemia group M protein
MPQHEGYKLEVDHRERLAKLAQLAIGSGLFEVSFRYLRTGDYLVNHSVLIERKSPVDLAASILDGRIFRQAAAMAHSRLRTLFLIEGTEAVVTRAFHPHSIIGACLSLAVMWRQPLLFSRDPEESLIMLQLLARQAAAPESLELMRCGYRPKRTTRRKLFVLQGLPGVGPKFAAALLCHFGSVEKIMTAEATQLMEVRGCGPKKARAIREVLE